MTTWEPLLRGIAFAGYRSFASEWQPIEFPSKVTVLAGINNSGKSNVLRYLQEILPQTNPANHLNAPRFPTIAGLDIPQGFASSGTHRLGVPIPASPLSDDLQLRLRRQTLNGRSLGDWQRIVMSLLATGEHYWSIFEGSGGPAEVPVDRIEVAMAALPTWHTNFREVLSLMGGGEVDPGVTMRRLLTSIGGFNSLPPVATIVASRRVEVMAEEEMGGASEWLSGRGIIDSLFKLQNPGTGEWDGSRRKWGVLNGFVKTILDDPDARINIPYDAQTIQVETASRVLPLANLGSGIEQVIVLGAGATLLNDTLVCIEEPETNLHPLLQKKLIRYLTDATSNQYVIATHSSHLLDDPRATAYHLRLSDNGTSVRRARKPHELVSICQDLGYRPSDLMQTNCVIWVEGPSDRIYLRRWLDLTDNTVVEGIDYSIMFYGGKLLSHLTVDDDALVDFINLRRLNRASAVLIDSDKSGPRERINATKRRIKDEFEQEDDASGFAWVTKCYTIENYVPSHLLAEAVSEVHPGRTLSGNGHQWENPLKSSESRQFDKIAIARRVEIGLAATDLDRFDLRSRLGALSKFIRLANGRQ